MTVNGPTLGELNCLSRILHKARHRNVADAFLKAFMWACWPEWYERNKGECYVEMRAIASEANTKDGGAG